MPASIRLQAQRGFTLVEILIASTILFMVLASATLSYRTLVSSEQQASEVVELHTVLPVILDTLQNQIREQELLTELSGSGEIFRWKFEWIATQLRKTPPARRFDPNLSEFTDYQPRYAVYNIALTVATKDGKTRNFEYQELAWEKGPASPADSR